MKAEEVSKTILETYLAMIDAKEHKEQGWLDKLADKAGAEIAELSEADKYDALQVQDTAWKEIGERLETDLATAQAQVAVMAEAMTDVIECRGRGDAWVGERLRQALSAAPKVVWAGPIQVDAGSEGLPILVPIDDMDPLEKLRDKEFEVFVLDEAQSKSVKRRLAVQKGEGE